MTVRIIRRREVEGRTGKCRSSIYAGIQEGTFPAPISIGERSVGWIEAEIDEWIAERVAVRDADAGGVGRETNADGAGRETDARGRRPGDPRATRRALTKTVRGPRQDRAPGAGAVLRIIRPPQAARVGRLGGPSSETGEDKMSTLLMGIVFKKLDLPTNRKIVAGAGCL